MARNQQKKQLKRGTEHELQTYAGPQQGSAIRSNSLLTRFRTRITAIALVALLSTASAFASPSKQIANQGINQPRGMVRSTVPNPVIGGAPLHDYWVADTVLGFCRIDQVPDPANPGLTHGVINVATCFATGIFEPADYQVETNGVNGSNGYVFVASTVGVTRLSFIVDPTDRHQDRRRRCKRGCLL